MATTETAWQLRGEYLENCNCEVGFGFHIDDGTFGDVSLDGLNVAMIARTPGAMADGNWQVALYVDDHGLRWDNSGKNAHFAPINWSN